MQATIRGKNARAETTVKAFEAKFWNLEEWVEGAGVHRAVAAAMKAAQILSAEHKACAAA